MLRITNGVTTLMVSRGAYECMYKSAGFRPLEDEEVSSELGVDTYPPAPEMPHLDDSAQDEEDGLEDDELEDEEEEDDEPVDYSEIPLSELGFEELCDYADQLGINHDGIRSKKELRLLIKRHRES